MPGYKLGKTICMFVLWNMVIQNKNLGQVLGTCFKGSNNTVNSLCSNLYMTDLPSDPSRLSQLCRELGLPRSSSWQGLFSEDGESTERWWWAGQDNSFHAVYQDTCQPLNTTVGGLLHTSVLSLPSINVNHTLLTSGVPIRLVHKDKDVKKGRKGRQRCEKGRKGRTRKKEFKQNWTLSKYLNLWKEQGFCLGPFCMRTWWGCVCTPSDCKFLWRDTDVIAGWVSPNTLDTWSEHLGQDRASNKESEGLVACCPH